MNTPEHERFFDVRMPRWYRVTGRVVRVIGLLVFLGCAWQTAGRRVPGLLAE